MVSPKPSKSQSTIPVPAGDAEQKHGAPENSTLVVAIGASAGGHEAIGQILTHLPSISELAFVVITHIPADSPAHLAGFIQRFTPMPVLTATDNQPVEPQRIYVIPPGKQLTINNGCLNLHDFVPGVAHHHPVDLFFSTLAVDQGECAIAVLLSGFGTDGSEGVRQIHEHGGLVLVQDPALAQNPAMVNNAIATGAVDLILSPEDIASHLAQLGLQQAQTHCQIRLPAITGEQWQTLFAALKIKTGHDFSAYKRNTVLRRIDRRMTVNEVEQVQDYLAMLVNNPEEAQALYQELLIGVTSFFRDPDAFELLRTEIIPRLFINRDPEEPVRIWHACCATGEEVYSVAMLIQEYLDKEQLTAKVQIFATDLDESAVAHARSGWYGGGVEIEMHERWLDKFFSRKEGGWQIIKKLREMVIFAHHNIIKDPPFSRLDLMVCRNFLIYLNPDIQKRLIALFHQILNPGGFLFLGTAETVGLQSHLFVPISKTWKIFTRKEAEFRPETPFPFFSPIRKQAGGNTAGLRTDNPLLNPVELAEKLLIQRYVPARIIINERAEIIHSSKQASRYLIMPEGEPTRDLLRMAKAELRPSLRASIYKTFADQKENTFKGIKITLDGQETSINLTVVPLNTTPQADSLALVIFEPAPLPPAITKPAAGCGTNAACVDASRDTIITHLEEQLSITGEQLQATVEQLESSNEGFLLANEELMATNEELQSANEELQATNEELETSKEELQALNEELITVNAELQDNCEKLDKSNSDLENLFASSEIATIFLDRNLNIQRFSPALALLFNLIPADAGRPFHHLNGTINLPDLQADAEAVLASLTPVEREIGMAEGNRTFIMRVLPYWRSPETVEGVVVTLIDITPRKQVEEALRQNESQLRLFIEQAPAGLAMFDTEMRYLRASKRWLSDYGLEGQDILGRSHYDFFPELPAAWLEVHRRGLAGEVLREEADLFVRADGRKQWIRWELRPWIDAGGSIGGIVIFAEDITALKEAEELLRRYELLAEHSRDIILFIERDTGTIIEANRAACQAYGYSREELLQLPVTGLRSPLTLAFTEQQMAKADERGILFETIHKRKDGSTFPAEVSSQGALLGGQRLLLSIVRDITERRQGEATQARLAALVDSSDDAIIAKDLKGTILTWNNGAERLFGYSPEEAAGQPMTLIIPDERSGEEQEILAKLSGGASIIHFETQRRAKDGRILDVSLTISPLQNNQGQVTGISTIARDITVQKQAQMAIQLSEKRLQLALDATSEGLWDWDVPSGKVYRSPRYLKLVRRLPEEDTADFDFFKNTVHPDDLPRVLRAIEAHKAGQTETIHFEYRLIPQAASERWLRVRGQAVSRDADGAPLRIVGTLADVTRQKQSEEALLLAEQRRSLALEAAQAGTWEWDLQTNENIWSDELWPIYGLEPGSCQPSYEAWVQIIHPDDRAQVEQAVSKAAQNGTSFRIEWRLNPAGTEEPRWLMARGRPVRNQQGQIFRYLGIVIDITERKLNELSRSRLETQLQQAQKMEAIGTLAGGIAHDFNNILAAILGYAEMARDAAPLGSVVIRDLDKVLEAGGRAANLVRQILAFSRQHQAEAIPIQPLYLVKEAIKLLRPALPSTITINNRFGGKTRSILADPTQIHQIVMNLCTNAFHAMEQTGGVLEIGLTDVELSARDLAAHPEVKPGNFVKLTVADTGIGIAPEIREKIFDPYFTTKEVGRGTGLGLAIVHGIVSAAGGFLVCESELGHGAAFHVFFPAVTTQAAKTNQGQLVDLAGHERLLLIDDEEILTDMGRIMLERLGYQVTTRTNSLEALAVFQNQPQAFDAVITDQTMPGMTGIDLARRMLQIRPDIPIILCTGYSSLIDEEQVGKLGIKGFAMKPLTKNGLGELIRKVLDENKPTQGH